MVSTVQLHAEFAQVVTCERCSPLRERRLLRDDGEHVPQPGYVGTDYGERRVLLVGQNPALPSRLAEPDRLDTAALRDLMANATVERYDRVASILNDFIPCWPVSGSYFPLAECGLRLTEIAYCNIVRCRTVRNAPPPNSITDECIGSHFIRWLALLEPRVVVFIGKWAADRGGAAVAAAGIPYAYMNRQRSLSAEDRRANRAEVVALVRKVLEAGAKGERAE